MISRAGNKPFLHAFTLIEILAVLMLLSVFMLAAVTSFISPRRQVRAATFQFVKDLQGSAVQSVREGNVLRLSINQAGDTYEIQSYRPPRPRPADELSEEFKAWEEEQKAFDSMTAEERGKLTTIERGRFVPVKRYQFDSSVQVQNFLSQRVSSKKSLNEETPREIYFYPTGEVDQVLIVLSKDGTHPFTVETDPLTGRVRTYDHEVTESEWKDRLLKPEKL